MIGFTIRTLNKAEKTLLFAICAALILISGKPQIANAGEISSQAFEAPDEVVVPALPAITIKKTLVVAATAYSSTPDQTDATPFNTSNGKEVYDGLIAANWLPYNTKIRIPDFFGDKIFTVNDRMNKRYDTGRLDVWMKTREEAKRFGIKRIRIQIVE